MHAAVQLFAYDEADRLGDTLDMVAAQSTPDDIRVDYEAWVTPTTTHAEDDPTYQIAADHPAFTAREAPDGKISSRNVAHDDAVARGIDAIAVWDADVTPEDTGTLATLLEPLRDGSVSATNSSPKYYGTPFAPAQTLLWRVRCAITPYMHGQASAFSTDAWQHVGPFDDDVEQTSLMQVWFEEERGFYKKLSDVGRVVSPGAVVYEEDRRVQCRIERTNHRFRGREMSDYCKRMGTETFHPREHIEQRQPADRDDRYR